MTQTSFLYEFLTHTIPELFYKTNGKAEKTNEVRRTQSSGISKQMK